MIESNLVIPSRVMAPMTRRKSAGCTQGSALRPVRGCAG